MGEQMDEQVSQNGSNVIYELSASNPIFAATGTAMVKVTVHGVETIRELPIQSVDVEDVNRMVGPEPPIPNRATGGNPKFVPDPEHPQYKEKIQERNRRFVMAMACFGLRIPIKDKQGEVVWSADNTVKDLSKAIEALHDAGIVYSQIFAITRAINDLTTFAEETATQD